MSESDARTVLWGRQRERIEDRLRDLDPDLARYVLEFAYGEVYERPGLDLKTKELLACVMLMSLGNPDELKTHLRGALRAGASEEELRETLLFAIPYLGFPRVVGAMQALRELLEARKKER
ncbi:4-carboxymuconolactone decarboxylase [Deinobacterium chartae]|uniref:4-carboxymuconolactone decarboxylase n=1 Tax=Deinobacterium chartae TaxID=521158 RepID=A0A841HV07_9DEIO|nr:carboxymuconolactone decarboxylase family protein [Deinobacterium chartae]MBB6097311.1 4-carboxymuconolactone decarboxylase [Deinobacterium chartae]